MLRHATWRSATRSACFRSRRAPVAHAGRRLARRLGNGHRVRPGMRLMLSATLPLPMVSGTPPGSCPVASCPRVGLSSCATSCVRRRRRFAACTWIGGPPAVAAGILGRRLNLWPVAAAGLYAWLCAPLAAPPALFSRGHGACLRRCRSRRLGGLCGRRMPPRRASGCREGGGA